MPSQSPCGPSSETLPMDGLQRLSPLLEVQEATPPGGFKGEALALRRSSRLPWRKPLAYCARRIFRTTLWPSGARTPPGRRCVG